MIHLIILLVQFYFCKKISENINFFLVNINYLLGLAKLILSNLNDRFICLNHRKNINHEMMHGSL